MKSGSAAQAAFSQALRFSVLLVDGDADTRAMYAEFIRFWRGSDVDEASDGRVALAKAISRHPDVIVTEIRLPGLGGIELCGLLRQDPSMSGMPIVIVTDDVSSSALEAAARAGADAVLEKPCVPERLLTEIANVMVPRAVRLDPARALAGLAVAQMDTASALNRAVPPFPPRALVCPSCDQPLRYVKSYIGGVSAREQWDSYSCRRCGIFEYRHRTRRLRRVT
jgi:CheY-like chemotaxis protein